MKLEKEMTQLNIQLRKRKLLHKGIKDFLIHYSDIEFVPVEKNDSIVAFYCKGMIDSNQLNEYFNQLLLGLTVEKIEVRRMDNEEVPPVGKVEDIQKMIEKLFSGNLILFKEGNPFFQTADISKLPQRSPEASTTEVSIKGPKDSFTEELNTNISLIRKRMKSVHLYCESFHVGSMTKTEISLLYLENKVKSETIEEVRKRLNEFKAEGIVSSGQLEQGLSDKSLSIFPLMDYITRPDYAVESMLQGRFIIIVNGTPSILIGPINLFELIKSPEDIHFPFYFVFFQRILRLAGLFISIFLPGIWIGLSSVNMDQLPFDLLATVVVSREGLPFPAGLEAFIILFLFELLREAGIRMPTIVGQTISVVGGIIIGDAAIRAGLASPTMIVIIALSAAAKFTIVNQSLVGTVAVVRIYSMVMSIFLGIYGLFISLLTVLVYLSRLDSFKVAYLEPVVSLNLHKLLSVLLNNPFKKRKLFIPLLQKRRK